ncbi:MAG: hypothetical protein KGO51_15600 [Alphaproteobacteria bacterium]|nr:hypothetical protein [Alphaproteobacteria bacterium]
MSFPESVPDGVQIEGRLLDLRGAIEDASGRLREAGALLEVLDAAECLESGLPGRPDPGRQRAVSLLAVLRRELACVCEGLERAILSTPDGRALRS